VAEFSEMSIFGTEGGLREDLKWRKLPDGLNDVKVSKGQFFITTDDPRSFACRSLRKGKRKSEVGRKFLMP